MFVRAEDVQSLKKEIVGKFCNGTCKGLGTVLAGDTFEDCSCVKEFAQKVKYLEANIPRKYWNFSFRFLLKKFEEDNQISLSIIKKYADKVEEMAQEGVGLFIQGKSGLAKSALSYYILKEALKKGVVCYAVRMSNLTRLLYDSLNDEVAKDQLEYLQEKVQLLLIDEIEKDYNIKSTDSFTGAKVNEFFGVLYDRQKALIVTSNKPKALLKETHAENVVDRLNELGDVVLVGESYRKPSDALQKIME